VHVDGVGPFGLQRRPRGLFRVSPPKKEFQRTNAIQAEADRQRGEEAGKILEKIEKHIYDQSWAEVKKKEDGGKEK